jgi:hypothetical protein
LADITGVIAIPAIIGGAFGAILSALVNYFFRKSDKIREYELTNTVISTISSSPLKENLMNIQ